MAVHQAPRPWDSPGQNTRVSCHFLLQCMKVKSESDVAQLCPMTLRTPWTAAYQAPPSMGFSRQDYWSGVPLCRERLKKKNPLVVTWLWFFCSFLLCPGMSLSNLPEEKSSLNMHRSSLSCDSVQRRQVGIFQSVLTRDSRGRKCSRKYQWYAKVRFPKDGFLFLNIFF